MALHEQLARIDRYRELAGFQTEPAQMRAAGPGKIGELRLGFSLLSSPHRVVRVDS